MPAGTVEAALPATVLVTAYRVNCSTELITVTVGTNVGSV